MKSAPSRTTIAAAGGDIVITPIMHASVQIEYAGRVIQVDPAMGDYTNAKLADLVLVTDIHEDHLNAGRIGKLRKPGAPVVVPAEARKQADPPLAEPVSVIANGETKTVAGIAVQAVPMYNVKNTTGSEPFHTKGRGNGYVVTLGGKRLYFAGDTECVPEIRALNNIDVAFLPMNLPFTMPPSEAAECAKAFRPATAIAYHFQGSNPDEFAAALKGSGIETRILNWYPTVFRPDVVAMERPGSLVDVGGRKLHIYCTGRGAPTVALETAGSAFAIDWLFVQPEVAKTNRVCSLDRAGFGWSDPTGASETVAGSVADLHAALQAAGEKPPYVIAGATLGAVYARAYDLQFPGEVGGFVMIDGLHEDSFIIPGPDGKPAPGWSLTAEQMRAAIERMLPAGAAPPPPLAAPSEGAPFDKLPPNILTTRVTFEMRAAKTMAWGSREQMIETMEAHRRDLAKLHEAGAGHPQPLGRKPLVVLTPENGVSPESRALQAKLATLSANAVQRVVAKSGSEIYLYQPSAVVAAIHDVVVAVTGGSKLPDK